MVKPNPSNSRSNVENASNSERAKIQASSKSIRLTIRDILTLLEGNAIEQDERPLRNLLRKILSAAITNTIPLPEHGHQDFILFAPNNAIYIHDLGSKRLVELADAMRCSTAFEKVERCIYLVLIENILNQRRDNQRYKTSSLATENKIKSINANIRQVEEITDELFASLTQADKEILT